MGIAIVTILHLRLSIPGPATQFSTADNPTAKANTILTRFYTFLYLPVFNFKLLVYPHTLSFDWGMDAIPRITSLFDARNIVSMLFYCALCRIVIKSLLALRRTTPKATSNKRLGRTIQKRKHQASHSPKSFDAVQTVQTNQLWASENSCSVCRQGLKYRVAASYCGVSPSGGASKKQVISLSPLKKYIRNNKSLFSTNNNNNESCSEVMRDQNNNNPCAIDENFNATTPSPPAATLAAVYQQHIHPNNRKLSVKSLSSTLAILADHLQSAEQTAAVKQTKLNGASATLISITLLTLPFLPASNLLFYVGFVVAERILYLPSVGFCLLIGLGLGKLINFKVQCRSNGSKSRAKATVDSQANPNVRSMATVLLLIILISACSLKTIQRSRDWQDEESLYRSAIRVNPPKGNFSFRSTVSFHIA